MQVRIMSPRVSSRCFYLPLATLCTLRSSELPEAKSESEDDDAQPHEKAGNCPDPEGKRNNQCGYSEKYDGRAMSKKHACDCHDVREQGKEGRGIWHLCRRYMGGAGDISDSFIGASDAASPAA